MIWGKRIYDSCGFGTSRWFAWRPVRLEDGRWAWLCFVERFRVSAYDFRTSFIETTYRLIEGEIADSELETLSST